MEERCNNEFTFETLPCFEWIPEPTAFERPEQPNSHPDLGKGHVRKVGYRPRRASKILKLQTSRRHAKGIRDELGAPRPGFENSILNRFSAYFKAITYRIMAVLKPIVGLVPLWFDVRNYRTRHPLWRAPNQAPSLSCENQPGKASV